MPEKYDKKYDACPVCHSASIYHYHSDFRSNDIYKCNSCGLQFMNPVYSDAYLEKYYAGYISPEYTQKTLDEQYEVAKQNFSVINRFKSKKGKMLDFGMGNGTYAQCARELGWQVSGYDVDCATTESLAKKLDMDIRCGNFDDIDWGDTRFDLIYAHHVIEHLKDPMQRLNSFQNILNDDGVLYIGVPNISAWGSRFKYFLEKCGIKKSKIGKYYDSEHHILYFNPRSLTKLLELSGYKVLYTCNASKPKPYQNPVLKFLRQNIKEKMSAGVAFLIIAEKI
ncbi:MAG: class I SAM-dependent methyltransferase [Gammaproteobacteria bacterium]|nr:class I SAM-dependent methyltransferase [Gammaproteobacteria bacterium]